MTWGPDYDRWLESDMERRSAESDAFVAWCEEQDPPMDPESEAAEEAWVLHCQAESFVPPTEDEWLEMAYEDAQEQSFDASSY